MSMTPISLDAPESLAAQGRHEAPCVSKLEAYLDKHIAAAGIATTRRAAISHDGAFHQQAAPDESHYPLTAASIPCSIKIRTASTPLTYFAMVSLGCDH